AEGEKSWHMPLDDDYKDLLKSAFADLANIGGRWGGAISAAYFLKEFAGDTPWVHLDIAGTAWLDEAVQPALCGHWNLPGIFRGAKRRRGANYYAGDHEPALRRRGIRSVYL